MDSIDPAATPEPTATALWARVRTIIAQAGPVYGRDLGRTHPQAHVARAVFTTGRLGTKAPEAELIQALRERPVLWQADDGSEQWRNELRGFMAQARKIIEHAGQDVVEGLSGREVGFKAKGGLATNAAAMEQAVRGADNRFKRLLGKIRQHPDQVTQSVLKHLSTDAAVWHNSMVYLAGKAPPGFGPLMRLGAEVVRQDKCGVLFDATELARIARASTGVWLTGAHRDKERLRMRVAVVLGEMLDDPGRRGHALSVLGGLDIPKEVDIPEAADMDQAVRSARTALVPALEQWAAQELSDGMEDESMEVQVAKAVVRGGLDEALTDADWVAAGRMLDTDPRPALYEVLDRVSIALIDAVDVAAFAVEGDAPAPAAGARKPGP